MLRYWEKLSELTTWSLWKGDMSIRDIVGPFLGALDISWGQKRSRWYTPLQEQYVQWRCQNIVKDLYMEVEAQWHTMSRTVQADNLFCYKWSARYTNPQGLTTWEMFGCKTFCATTFTHNVSAIFGNRDWTIQQCLQWPINGLWQCNELFLYHLNCTRPTIYKPVGYWLSLSLRKMLLVCDSLTVWVISLYKDFAPNVLP